LISIVVEIVVRFNYSKEEEEEEEKTRGSSSD
jgi:hypothetical protein